MVGADYTVRLERLFQGPLDLLLHLVREQEVEIHEIEISKILKGYLAYLEELESLDIEFAGEFLVMAATLMSIKSRSLLPGEEIDLEEEIDPRDELIQRLVEYRRFRDTADGLGDRYRARAREVARGWHEDPGPVERTVELGELTTWDLFSTYSRLMRETLADRPHQVSTDARPLRFYIDQVVAGLRNAGSATLRALLDEVGSLPQREALVGSFCALLELVRLELVDVEQADGEKDIQVSIRKEHLDDVEEILRSSVIGDEAEGALREPSAAPASEGPSEAARE